MPPRRILLSCAVLVALAFPAGAAPDEDLLGKAAGSPIGPRANWFYDEGVRVGSFSNADKILPHYTLAKSTTPLLLSTTAAASKIEYRFENQSYSLDDFLARQRVTGFLLIREGEVLAEWRLVNDVLVVVTGGLALEPEASAAPARHASPDSSEPVVEVNPSVLAMLVASPP